MLLDFFQLREQPFSVSPHPSYLYASRSRSEALHSIAHAAAFPGSVFGLLGVPGVGKTTLLNQFLSSLPSSTRTVLLPHAHFSAAEVLDDLLRELPASVSGVNSPTLSNLHPAGTSCVLVADNAEQLDAAILETLCRLADSRFSVILAGRLPLGDKLQRHPSLLSFATKPLEALSGRETAAYIEHRLRQAGHPGIVLFERESVALIAERSQGIPRCINQICFRALLEGYATGCRTLSPEIVEKAAQKLEYPETPRPGQTRQSPHFKSTLPAERRALPQSRPQPGKRTSSSAVRGQRLLRRAAVATLAATTLVLPYLAAKRISESIRPDTSAPAIPSPLPSDSVTGPATPGIGTSSGEPAGEAPSPTEHLLAASSAPPINLFAHRSKRETAPRPPADDSIEGITTDSPRLSLARELGLKINRIAIDPGHGGYDTGTIGPSGLMEKELCLDVALRLGRMIKENIPGAEVIYTRTDDRHVPLEDRTAAANDAQADLFISIHANSSGVRQIRGVETYYVSLAASPEAREIATRENAVADSSLHSLPDLIKKITRNENLAESRQLASAIQTSLSQRLQLVSRQESNRGVKRAPFIVLTGANMPAVLSEISFVSNPSDEKLLLENDQRQRVTEGLFRGILAYLGTMPAGAASDHTRTASASAETLSSIPQNGLR